LELSFKPTLMKQIAIILLIFLAFSCKTPRSGVNQLENIQEESQTVDLAHNSQNSLRWADQYEGVLPCADCRGRKITLLLKKDGTYQKSTLYLGKSSAGFLEDGIFEWLPDGNRIKLTNNERNHTYFKVEENRLRLLDQKGNPIENNSGNLLLLKKLTHEIVGKHWRAVELMGQAVEMNEGEGKQPDLILNEDGTYRGNGGCNSIFGKFKIENKNWIRFTEINMTEMSCDHPAYDDALQQVLSMAQQFQFSKDGQMQLIVGKRAPLAKFEAIEVE